MLNNAVLGLYAEEPQLYRGHTLELESSGLIATVAISGRTNR